MKHTVAFCIFCRIQYWETEYADGEICDVCFATYCHSGGTVTSRDHGTPFAYLEDTTGETSND